MNYRHAKRYARRHLAQVAAAQADAIEQRYRANGTWDELSRADAARVIMALIELRDELTRRSDPSSARAKTAPRIPVHPDQIAMFEE